MPQLKIQLIKNNPITLMRKTVFQRRDKIGLIQSLGLKTICEVGVRDGDHLLNVLIKSNPKLLIGVDLWLDDGIWSHNDIGLSQYAIDQMYSNLFKIQKTKSNLQFLRMESTKAAKSFEDGFFDMVYIDAGHTYDAVKSDIEAWWPKVRIGGVLCGHDFVINNSHPCGVVEAVVGFINQHNLMNNFHSTIDEWFILKQ